MQNRTYTIFFLIFILGFSSGLPLLLTSSTLQAWFTEQGLSLISIGSLSLVGIPYILKFLWAPFFDLISLPFSSLRKGWLLVFQFILIILFFLFSFIHPAKTPIVMAFVALVITLISASQDIIINALQIELVTKNQLGLSVAAYVTGYRVAMIVSGGLALILAQYIGFSKTYQLMTLIMIPCILATFFIKEPLVKKTEEKKFSFNTYFDPFKNILKRKNIGYFLFFIFYFKISYSLNLIMTPTFLLRDLHFSLAEVGTVNKTFGISMTILGVLMGGIIVRFLSMKNCLIYAGLAEALSNQLYALLALIGKNISLLFLAVSCESFFSGLESAVFTSFLMWQCDRKFTASQFAFLAAFSTLPRIILGPIAGALLNYITWFEFYIITILLFLPTILIIIWKYDGFLIQSHSADIP